MSGDHTEDSVLVFSEGRNMRVILTEIHKYS